MPFHKVLIALLSFCGGLLIQGVPDLQMEDGILPESPWVELGSTVRLICNPGCKNKDSADITWRRIGDRSLPLGTTKMGREISMPMREVKDRGEILCGVVCDNGRRLNYHTIVNVFVLPTPIVRQHPPVAFAGDRVTMICIASGLYPLYDAKLIWRGMGEQLWEGAPGKTESNIHNLSMQVKKEDDGKRFTCTLRLIGGQESEAPLDLRVQEATTNQLPGTTFELPATTSQLAATLSQLPATTSPLAATTSQITATTFQLPATTSQLAATTSQLPATTSEVAATSSHLPSTTSNVPAIASQLLTTTSQSPTTTSQLPTTTSQLPTTSQLTETTSQKEEIKSNVTVVLATVGGILLGSVVGLVVSGAIVKKLQSKSYSLA